jgi:acetylornithine deacetylase/succinyl-diaminopimelate desuccinylase-like protein
MRAAGMAVRVDAMGSVIGRCEGPAGAKTLLMGSHFDSVRDGGKYDGVLGILLPIAAVAELHRRGERPPVAIEIAAFSDEEGARFQTSFLASRAMLQGADSVRPLLERRDADGVTFADAMRAAGLDPARIDEGAHRSEAAVRIRRAAYRAGPVLLGRGAALGVVTSIAGGSRHLVTVRGEARATPAPCRCRCGTTPWPRPRRWCWRWRSAPRARISSARWDRHVKNGTGNVIAGEVEFTVDLRAPDDARSQGARGRGARALRRDRISARREGRGVEAPRGARGAVRAVVAGAGRRRHRFGGRGAVRLPSGAGHDAMILAEATTSA